MHSLDPPESEDFVSFILVQKQVESNSIPETNSEFTPENGWLEYYFFLLGRLVRPIFRGELAVRFCGG